MSTFAPVRRAVLAGFLLSALLGATKESQAADAASPTYFVISLVGDQFTVVRRRMQSGSRTDANERLEYPIKDDLFDRVAMIGAEEAIRRARPGANVLQASIRDARLFAAQDKILAETPESHDLRVALQALLAKHGATHLLLVTKKRSEASFKIVNSSIGSGSISGLGFYVDSATMMVKEGANETSPGFLSTYAYMTVSLLDAASLRVIRSENALESSMYLTVDSKDAVRSWDALTPEDKVSALENVIHRGVGRATTAVLAE